MRIAERGVGLGQRVVKLKRFDGSLLSPPPDERLVSKLFDARTV